MERTLIRIVRDGEGNAVTGLNMLLYRSGEYPTGSYVTAVEDTNMPGRYVFTIPDSLLGRFYDIYITGGAYNPYEENIEVVWDWKFSDIEITGETTIDLTTIQDDYGNYIPTDTLPVGCSYEHIITSLSTDRLVYIKSKSLNGRIITVDASSAGSSDTIKFNLYVYIGGNV